jgi:hypothetical protein
MHEDHLYLVGNTKMLKNVLPCLYLAVNLNWSTGNQPAFEWGDIILADGLLFALDAAAGDLRLVDPNPERYTELGAVRGILAGKQIWAPMALAGGRLLLRDQTHLKCLNVAAK